VAGTVCREGQETAQLDDGLKSRPKHVVVLTLLQYYNIINFVVFRLTDIAYCIAALLKVSP
jgi:hypothetical protein